VEEFNLIIGGYGITVHIDIWHNIERDCMVGVDSEGE